MIEVELKARINDTDKIEKLLITAGARPIGIENHVDTYYNSIMILKKQMRC